MLKAALRPLLHAGHLILLSFGVEKIKTEINI